MTRRALILVTTLALAAGIACSSNAPAPEPAASADRTPAPVLKPRAAEPKAEAPKPNGAPAPRKPKSDAAPAPTPAAPAAPEPEAPAAPTGGTLRITADVPNAQVFLDRVFLGAAPVTANDVKPGNHRLNVSAEGYDGIAESIDVEPGPRDVMIRFKEVKLNLAIDVVHKHRMGSCKGRLVATATGLRYDTTEKGDAFTAGMNDLEQFEIDYLEKNLKVKIRKGKQFNFTDPDGNADKLFVFHRDVEKARARLKKGDAPAQ